MNPRPSFFFSHSHQSSFSCIKASVVVGMNSDMAHRFCLRPFDCPNQDLPNTLPNGTSFPASPRSIPPQAISTRPTGSTGVRLVVPPAPPVPGRLRIPQPPRSQDDHTRPGMDLASGHHRRRFWGFARTSRRALVWGKEEHSLRFAEGLGRVSRFLHRLMWDLRLDWRICLKHESHISAPGPIDERNGPDR